MQTLLHASGLAFREATQVRSPEQRSFTLLLNGKRWDSLAMDRGWCVGRRRGFVCVFK